jgi:hypothetical protein
MYWRYIGDVLEIYFLQRYDEFLKSARKIAKKITQNIL